MELKKKPASQYKVNIRPIISLLIGLAFFSLILLVTMHEAAKGSKGIGAQRPGELNSSQESEQAGDTPFPGGSGDDNLAVVTKLDEAGKQIGLFDTNSQETLLLSYNGATDVSDKYGQLISMSQVPLGAMVDTECDKASGKLLKLQISSKAWDYKGVNNLSVDKASNIMKIAAQKYKYTDRVVIFDGDTQIPVDNLAEQDQLTVRGYDQTIWSITVTRGHGTVTLKDYEPFLGDSITIGYEAMQQITEDIAIKVREGNFNLTIENGSFSATKNITVYRNKETVVSLSGMGPTQPKTGLVEFEIDPFGADLFIDGKLTPYAGPIELAYGDHQIEVSLGGFTTYQGTLDVQEAGKMIKIALPESGNGEEAVAAVDSGSTEGGTVVKPGSTQDSGADTGNESTDTNGETDQEASADNGSASDAGDNADAGAASDSDETADAGTSEDTVDKDHSIIIQGPAEASVYLNGEFKGIAPVSFEKIIGTHVLTFIREGYSTKSYTVEVPDNGLDTYFTMDDLVKKE